MTEYELRLARLTDTLRDAVTRHHRLHGTVAPDADRVTALNVVSDHMSVGFPVDGPEQRNVLGMSAKDDVVHDHDVARIVARASMWRRWHARIAEIGLELPAELERLTRGTEVQVTGIVEMGVNGTEHSVAVQYFIDVRQLDGSFRPHAARWSIQRNEVTGGVAEWLLRENASLLPNQRRLARMLRESGGKPKIVVERSLATRLLAMPDRREASRKLFAAANGQTGTKVPWRSITLLEARDGRVIATIPLSNTARIRDDKVTVKGAVLPSTVTTALRGRPATTVAEHELLQGRVIKAASTRKDGLVVELERDDVDYVGLRRTLDGED